LLKRWNVVGNRGGAEICLHRSLPFAADDKGRVALPRRVGFVAENLPT
jgi:hypothetical protein